MQKTVLATAAFLACLVGLTGGRIEAQCGSNPPCVDSGDIVDGQVKTADLANGAVNAAKLGANAVTGAKVANNSLSEQDFSVAGRLVVAKSGGDFTTIGAALASITPTSSNPYVIEVMPGTYTGQVTLKSFVHLRGAGVDKAILTCTTLGCTVINASCSYCSVSGLTVQGDGSNTSVGISVGAGNPWIEGSTITGHRTYGMIIGGGTPVVLRNRLTGNSDGDIIVASSAGQTHVSFNTVDFIDDEGPAVGRFNVTSNGAAQPAL